MADPTQAQFYDRVTPIPRFADLAAGKGFVPLPDDWIVGAADIVDSTGEIARGRYKTVNTIGAAVIAAMTNALGSRRFPYVFGGDGASFAVAAADAPLARQVLAALRRWADAEFGIALRAALVPVPEIRATGRDVRVARLRVSDGVDYAMFNGGGMGWAEEQMKAGRFAVAAAPGTRPPDLTGLSCRWSNMRARNGMILSIVVLPAPGVSEPDFAEVVRGTVEIAEGLARSGHPVPPAGPRMVWPTAGLEIESRLSRGTGRLWMRRLALLAETLLALVLFRTGIRLGGFQPDHYTSMISRNADFRKLDDGLKMTLDCDDRTRRRIERHLEQAQRDGRIVYGTFAQDEAMMTCVVPSVVRDDHVHFVDGAAGGYAMAAARIRAQRPDRNRPTMPEGKK